VSVDAAYIDAAFSKMLEAARRAEDRLNHRPFGEGTNSIGGLVVHCVEVCEFWLGHVALGRESRRDRDHEFRRRPTIDGLEQFVAAAGRQARADLEAIAEGEGRPSEVRDFLVGGPSDESLVLHVLEELYQHLGHMEITLDAFAAGVVGEPLHHLALVEDWEGAIASGGPYRVSTIGRSLDQVGYIHLSFADQVAATARRHYAGREDVLVLEIEPRRLHSEVRLEPADGSSERFPHLYGPLPLDSVVSVRPLSEMQ
jgi:uncharacterized protein (DUF952 family)/uncharacterized damage-inducible protein DinB